jgi:hypothetical protein
MLFDMTALASDITYKILTATVTPRPIAWVTTLSARRHRQRRAVQFLQCDGA